MIGLFGRRRNADQPLVRIFPDDIVGSGTPFQFLENIGQADEDEQGEDEVPGIFSDHKKMLALAVLKDQVIFSLRDSDGRDFLKIFRESSSRS